MAAAVVGRDAFNPRRGLGGVVEQPAFDQRLGPGDRCRRHLLRNGVLGQLQLGVEDLAHLQAQRIGEIGADQAVVIAVIRVAVEQVELGGEFDVAQAFAALFPQEEIELPDRAILAVADLQAVGGQRALLGEVEGHQLFSVQAKARIEAIAKGRLQRRGIGIEVVQPIGHRRRDGTQRGDPALPVRAVRIKQVGRIEQPGQGADVGPRQVAPFSVECPSVGRHGRLWQGTGPAMPWPFLPAFSAGRPGGRWGPRAHCHAA